MASPDFSEGAMSIFAFGAYHSLVSGEPVTSVVLDDKNGHHADSKGVKELKQAGMINVEGDRATFTDAGNAMLARVIQAIRDSAT